MRPKATATGLSSECAKTETSSRRLREHTMTAAATGRSRIRMSLLPDLGWVNSKFTSGVGINFRREGKILTLQRHRTIPAKMEIDGQMKMICSMMQLTRSLPCSELTSSQRYRRLSHKIIKRGIIRSLPQPKIIRIIAKLRRINSIIQILQHQGVSR